MAETIYFPEKPFYFQILYASRKRKRKPQTAEYVYRLLFIFSKKYLILLSI